jgi:AraC-like DNA-binding protein
MDNDLTFLKEYFSAFHAKVICGSYMECNEYWKSSNFLPDFYRIYYITEGECWIRVGDTDLYPRKGELYWLPANITQQYSLTDMNNPMKHYWIHFYATVGEQIPFLDVINLPICIKLENEKEIKDIFENLLQVIEQNSGLADEVSVLIHLLTLIRYYISNCENEISVRKSSALEKIRPAIDYIERNLSDDLTIIQLSKIVNLQTNYFSALFKNVMGLSPLKFILQKRFEKAKMLLIITNKPINIIADEVGFSNQFSFSEIFKKYFCLSPLNYRKTYKKVN